MWFSVYPVVVVMVVAAGVLAEDPHNSEGAKRQVTTSDTMFRAGNTSSAKPVDCADHLMAGATASGVYEIHPFTCTCGQPVFVWCDMETDGGGWTVFLNRENQTHQTDFNRTWNDYKKGFGSPYTEYYLGNDLLHQMTNSRAYGIRLDVELTSGSYESATYEGFKVNSEDNRYSVSVTGSLAGVSQVTNCFRYINGRSFSTLDRDYASFSGNCAAVRGGGWWYYNCKYFTPTSTYKSALPLYCYNNLMYATRLQVKLRPAICDSSFKTIHLMDKGCGCEVPAH